MKPPPATAHVNRLIALSLALLLFSGQEYRVLGTGSAGYRFIKSSSRWRTQRRGIEQQKESVRCPQRRHQRTPRQREIQLGLSTPRKAERVTCRGYGSLLKSEAMSPRRNVDIDLKRQRPHGLSIHEKQRAGGTIDRDFHCLSQRLCNGSGCPEAQHRR